MTDAGHTYLHPGYKKPYPVETVLRDLAAQEGCDGEPYDAMVFAAAAITTLRAQLAEARAELHGPIEHLSAQDHSNIIAHLSPELEPIGALPNRNSLMMALVEARVELVRRVDMHECAMAERDDATLYSDEQRARADRAEQRVATLEAALAAQIEADDTPPFHFYRYINGVLMAEGVEINKETTLDSAMKVASRIASKGPNGEVPVLVYRNQPRAGAAEHGSYDRTALDRMLTDAREKALREAADELRGQGYGTAVRTILALIEKPNAR